MDSDGQNLGNYVGNRTSTRTHHHVNGHHSKSSWSIGWDGKEAQRTTSAPFTQQQQHIPPPPSVQVPTSQISALPTSSAQSSNRFACGTNQNCGNVITDRSSTRLHAPPGGKSSICFGDSDPLPQKQYNAAQTQMAYEQKQHNAPHNPVIVDSTNLMTQKQQPQTKMGINATFKNSSQVQSSNRFACGTNQNCGNVITDRSSTRLHAPPGGKSSICLGNSAPLPQKHYKTTQMQMPPEQQQINALPAPVIVDATNRLGQKQHVQTMMNSNPKVNNTGSQSSNKFACGTNQNSGNFITDRPSTRVHAPPGGRSQISFG